MNPQPTTKHPLTETLPIISVIVPTYNCAQYLPEALDSILAQQYPNLEIIVVDDGSSDGSAEIAESYGSPVRVIRQQNKGPAAARNRAAQEAKGEYLAFLDGDDIWLPGKLKAQVDYIQSHPEAKIVYASLKRWRMNEESNTYPPKEAVATNQHNVGIDESCSGWIYHKLLLDSMISIITAIIPHTLFDALGGFDESLKIGEDYDFWLRASRITQAHKLNRDVALYRINPASTTHVPRPNNIAQDMLLRVIKQYGLTSPNGDAISDKQMRRRLFTIVFNHGYMHYWNGTPCIALKSFIEAIGYDRKQVKAYIYCFMSYLRCKFITSKKPPDNTGLNFKP